MEVTKFEFEKAKFAYEVMRHEAEYRREKSWRIFTWTTTLLSGVTVALMALHTKSQDFALPLSHKVSLWVLIVILAAYACAWLAVNKRQAGFHKEESVKWLGKQGITLPGRAALDAEVEQTENRGGTAQTEKKRRKERRRTRGWYHSFLIPTVVAATVTVLTVYWIPCFYDSTKGYLWRRIGERCNCEARPPLKPPQSQP